MASNSTYDLDDPAVYPALDPSGLGQRIRSLPEHCKAAWAQVRSFPWPSGWDGVGKVVIGGMGGSAIAGDLVADLVAGPGAAPVLVVRDLTLPYAVDERSLFIACSYSGNTEETLELFGQAAQARARVLAIGRGGILAERAKAVGIPYITVGVATEPRTAVGYNYMLLAGALKQAGLAAISDAAAAAAIDALERSVPKLQEDSPLADNPAKQLAAALLNKLIVVYGGGLFYGVARRWKSQFNENAKVWAFSEAMPEVLHNSVEAYPSSSPVGGPVMALLLQPSPAQDRHARYYKAISRLLEKDRIEYQVVTAGAGSPQEQQLQMLLLGDYVSYYLAIAQGVDPAPNPSIDKAKKLLAGLD